MEFKVKVNRIGYSSKDITVEADSQEEANYKALDEAGNEEFSEHTSDYELEDTPSKEATLLEEIYHEIDMQCISDTDTVRMSSIRNILKLHGANPKNME